MTTYNESDVLIDISMADGKYRYVQTQSEAHVFRHGERWRDVTGDKMVASFAYELEEARSELESLRSPAEVL